MTTHTAPFGIGLPGRCPAPRVPQTAGRPVPACAAPATPWLERLATWAERQPMHHHMGSCRWL